VILAAGRGKRLLPLTADSPKPLTPVLGKPILEHVIWTLREAAIKDIIIVTGYLGYAIQRYFGDGSKLGVELRYVCNPVHKNGNAASLKASQDLLAEDESFLLLMSDHCIDKEIVRRAVRSIQRKPLLCVDRRPQYSPQIKDATRVFVNSEGYITDIGKAINSWNGIDTGVFLLDHAIFEVIEQIERTKCPVTISDCICELTQNDSPLWACDVSGLLWLDIDTPGDVKVAESVMREEN
jgi:NDP-sugar pyrophosphorylase family protein